MKLSPTRKAILLGCIHLAIVASLGGKLLLDRATRPRFWLKTSPVDPDLPIRGRYVSLRVEVPVRGAAFPSKEQVDKVTEWQRGGLYDLRVKLESTPQGLLATPAPNDSNPFASWADRWPERVSGSLIESQRSLPPEQQTIRLNEPLAYFIPEHVPDPSIRALGEELWVEVTLPKKGPLRPIQLAVKKKGEWRILKL